MPADHATEQVKVRFVTDEAEAVLAILEKRSKGHTETDHDWQMVFTSEGYIRLKQRDESFGAKDYDQLVKTYVQSARAAGNCVVLKQTLKGWAGLDIEKPAALASAYLPVGTVISCAIYPVIKPQGNSFVHDLATNPAIFLYLDPAINSAQLENIIAHELHHVGVVASDGETDDCSRMPAPVARLIPYLGGFMEGVAMLAAVGDPAAHPHAVSNDSDRRRWDRDLENFNADLVRLEKFFADVLSGYLTDEETTKTAMSFFGVQGPWYTVGWQMAVIVERRFGRAAVINSVRDPRELLLRFNEALPDHNRTAPVALNGWSPRLIETLYIK